MPATAQELIAIDHHIGGVSVSSENHIDVYSPLDGAAFARVAIADSAQLDHCVEVARNASIEWAATSLKNRIQCLFTFKHLCEQRAQEIGKIISQENGKTVAEAVAGLAKGLEVVEYACSLPQIMGGEVLEVSRGVDCYTRKFPLGVVAGITPFNFPAMVPLWMFPIAIACGNTFILKASEKTPHTANILAGILEEAGLPKGVFNVLHGDRATVEGILDHPGIAAAAFVGSTPVAKAVYHRGIDAGKRMLALGGAKNHVVLMPDADKDLIATNVCASAFGCAGQRCMAASVLIAVGDCDTLIDSIVAYGKGIVTGPDMGAIITEESKDRINGFITRAADNGANIKLDGRQVTVSGSENGYYVGPCIIDNVQAGDEAICDEIFGPVLSIIRVKTLDEAIAIENASSFGNAAAIYTNNGGSARYFEQHASAGMIGVNIGVPVPREPFSFGGWNDSRFGIGDITGEDGMRFWTQTKKITVKWSAQSNSNWMS
ncbi:MAG: CoA-acylating methylmalonate-semialdehyde dehydrogenase [Planctomycetes bacterium]|nr:CoA-acylating methylmalonate-semialdehyde dehydrogenase [Planctomycetota bacterium]